jgi:Phage integrase, N-terminal SAM-like domain
MSSPGRPRPRRAFRNSSASASVNASSAARNTTSSPCARKAANGSIGSARLATTSCNETEEFSASQAITSTASGLVTRLKSSRTSASDSPADSPLANRRSASYWVGAFDVPTTSGARKRVVVYGKTLAEAREKLGKVQQDVRSGIPVPDKVWKLGPYLEYWLENFVRRNRRPATYNLYEMIVRLYLKPGLGSRKLTSLTVPMVQEFLNRCLQKGDSVRKVQVIRTVLSAALTRAVREELIVRNVARLVELPQWQRGQIRPWAADEARAFLAAARPDPLYTAFVLLILYGLRRGEVEAQTVVSGSRRGSADLRASAVRA